ADDIATDFELWCIDDPDGRLRTKFNACSTEPTYRSGRFAEGYYATDHFGDPMTLHSFGNRHYVLGCRLERVVWPYFVKFFIFASSLRQRQLFLKAAAVVMDQAGVLILGRGSGGKTTFVQEICGNGGLVLSNSHAIVKGTLVTGVRTTMRVRQKAERNAHLGGVASPLRDGEILVDPFEQAPPGAPDTAELRAAFIIDFRNRRDEGSRLLAPADAAAFAARFSLGVSVYGLEEEMLELVDHDVVRFAEVERRLGSDLQELFRKIPCAVVRTDILLPGALQRAIETVGLAKGFNS
ncbi:MAG: hypothetical protein AAFQ17_07085, partial [Pseudomonadota bacterium]